MKILNTSEQVKDMEENLTELKPILIQTNI